MATDSTHPLPIMASFIDPLAAIWTISLTFSSYIQAIGTPSMCFSLSRELIVRPQMIIAGNVFQDGYFAADIAGLQRENVSLEGLLTNNSYYFIVEGNDKYPIVPSFKDWKFPHGEVPDLWPAISRNDLTALGTAFICGMTGVSYAIDRAHLVPQEESAWYQNNGMAAYGGDINCMENILPLSKNLHKCFDDRWFAIVPKLTTGGMQYVSHILAKQASELWPMYQNIIIRGLTSTSRPYLFARFAWAVLLRVKPFVNQGFPRQVIRVHVDNKEGIVDYKEELMTGIQLQGQYGGGGSKSATPIKRSRDAQDELEVLEDDYSEEETRTGDDIWDTEYDQGIPVRSAKRREQMSSDSIPDDKPALSGADRMALETSIGNLFASQSEQEPREE